MADTSRSQTRQELLEAGLDILRDEPRLDVLNARSVSRKAGLSTGAFYYYWDTQEQYLTDLLSLGLADRRFRWLQSVERQVRKLTEKDTALEDVIEQATRWGIESVERDPMFLVQMSVWSRHAVDPESKEALAKLYRDFHNHFLPLYREILEGGELNLEPRPPFTYDTLAVVVTALVEGLVLQRRLDPDAVPRDLFGWVLLALAALALRPQSDNRSLQEALAETIGIAWGAR
jgi:AcrR family transcriptional regulator